MNEGVSERTDEDTVKPNVCIAFCAVESQKSAIKRNDRTLTACCTTWTIKRARQLKDNLCTVYDKLAYISLN